MKKYHFVFTDRLGKLIIEYYTDIVPPVVGDIVRLDKVTNNTDQNIYVVYDRWYMPIDENRVDITLTLDLYDSGVFE